MSENLNAFEPINDVPSLPSLAKGLQDASRKHAGKIPVPTDRLPLIKKKPPSSPFRLTAEDPKKKVDAHC